jgi:hypothetical protein
MCVRQSSYERMLRLSKEFRVVEVSVSIMILLIELRVAMSCASSGGETESTSDYEST